MENYRGKYNVEIISRKYKTPDHKRFNSNNLLNNFQFDGRSNGGVYNQNVNNNNYNLMNPNNLNLNMNGMNVIKKNTQNGFSNKEFEKNKNQQILTQKNNRMPNYDKELLKVFIYIYFYEKITMEKNIFINNDEDFYLINPEWIEDFKKFYSYDKLEKKLKYFSTQYNYYNYYNIDKNIEFIIDNLSKEDIFKNVKLFPDLKKINFIMTKLSKINNITFTCEGIIIPAKIMNLINDLNEEIKNFIHPKTFHFNSQFVYYINSSKKIIVGYLENYIKFIPKYIFDFNNGLEQPEIEKLISTPINDYINKIKCNSKLFFQVILNEEKKQIGNLIILNQTKNSSNSTNKYGIKDN